VAEPTSLEVIRGNKKVPCPYCGGPPHKTPFACPRIQGVHYGEDGSVAGVEFRDGFEFPPDDAA
jgi:hypothetical protein